MTTEVRHIIQVLDNGGNWKDFAPGAAPLSLEQTIEVAYALKPDSRRMRVITLTQTAEQEIGI